MTVASTTIDPSRRLDFYFRVKRDGTKKFIFLDADGGAIDISAYDFALYIKEYAGARTNIIAFTIGTGLEISGAGFNELTATFTVANTNVKEGQYYVELVKLSTNKTYLNGYAIAHNGVFDGVTVNTNDVTITDGADTVTIQITESGGVGSSILTGAQIEAALGYTPATGDDISTYVDQALTDFAESQEGFPTSDEIADSLIADTDALQRIMQAGAIYLPSAPVAPEFVGVPLVTGTLEVPNILTITPPPVTGQAVITFYWKRNTVLISGQSAITYNLVNPTDFGVDIIGGVLATGPTGLTDTAESVPVTIAAAPDTAAPVIVAASVDNITDRECRVNIQTDKEATHYFIGVAAGSAAPTGAQVEAGVNYGAVTVVVAGNAQGLSTNQNTTVGAVTGLEPETAYDFHKVAKGLNGVLSTVDTDSNVTTLAEDDEEYITIPTAEAFTDAVTLDPDTLGDQVTVANLNGKREILIPEDYPQRLLMNGWAGTEANPYKVKSASDVTRSWIGGAAVTQGQQAMAAVPGTGCNHIHLSHLGLKGNPLQTVSGISGFAHESNAAGVHLKMMDVFVKEVSFANFHINDGTTGDVYESLDFSFLRAIGHPVEGEPGYFGSTNKTSGFSNINNLTIYNFYGAEKGRELQLTHCLNFFLNKGLIYNVGQANIAGQRNLVQIHNSIGTIAYYIFDLAPDVINNFCHGVTFYRCYFRWSNAVGGLQGKLTGDATGTAFGPNAAGANGQPNRFIECTFDPVQVVPWFMRIREDECAHIFQDNRVSTNLGGFWLDSRVDTQSFALTETGTVTFAPDASTVPTYINHDPADEANHGKVTSAYHKSWGMGWLTKDPVVTVVTTPATQDSLILFTNVTDTSFTVSWTGVADGSMLILREGAAVADLPVDGVNYASSPAYGTVALGSGFIVHKGAANTVDVTGLTPSTVVHGRVCALNGTASNVKFNVTTASGNPASQATTAPPAFHPSSILWDFYADASTAEANLASGIWANSSAATAGNKDADALVALNAPTWDASKQAVRHVKTSNQRFTIQAANNYSTPIYYIEVFITPTTFTGTQTLCGLSNTHKIYFNSAGLLHISGVSTGITLAVDTVYYIVWKLQGASSFYYFNSLTEVPISLSTNALGTPNWRLGGNFSNADHFNGWKRYVFLKRGLTAEQLTNMLDWLNNL